MKKTTRYISLAIVISLLAAGLTSCGNLFVKVPDTPVQAETGSITGFILIDDALRAAVVDADFSNTTKYTYNVVAIAGDKQVKGSFHTDNPTWFTISGLLFNTEYTITATVNENDKTVLTGQTDKITIKRNMPSISIDSIELSPLSSGSGSINLTVKADAAVSKVTASLETKSQENFTSSCEEIFSENHTATITFDDVPSGGRKLTLRFYDNAGDLVYQCNETVNVLPNMSTTKWVDNSNSKWFETVNEGTTLSITQDCITSFKMGKVCIDSNSDSEETGAADSPFKSLDKALKRINESKDDVFIYIKSGSVLTLNSEIPFSNSVTIESYSDAPGDFSSDSSSFTLKAENGYSFTVSDGKKLTVNGMNIASDTTKPQTGSFFTVESGAEATFTNCSFNNRNASEGSAVKNAGSATFSSCSFEGNSASSNGGVVYNTGSATFSGCSFKDNSAPSNGGVVYNTGSATFSGCSFKDNSATAGEAVIYNSNQLTLENCTISYSSQTTAPTAILSEGESEAGPLITIKGTGNSIAGTIVLKDRSGIKIAESQNDTKKLGTLDISEHSEDENSLQFLTTDNGLSVAEAQDYFEGFILGDYQDEPQEGKLVLYPNDAVYVDSTITNSTLKGTFKNPYTTISAALNALKSKTGTDAVTVYIKGGTTSPIEYNWSENITLTRSATLKVYGTTPAGTETGTATIKPAPNYGFTIDSSGTDEITFEAEGLIFDDSTSQAATSGFVTIGSNVSSASFTNCQFNNCPATSETAAFSTSASVTLNSCSFSNNVASGGNAGIAIAVNPGAVLTLKGSTWFGENDVIKLSENTSGEIKCATINVPEELTLNNGENKSWKLITNDISIGSQILTGDKQSTIRDFFTIEGKYIDDYGKVQSGSRFYVNRETANSVKNGTKTFPFASLEEAFGSTSSSVDTIISIFEGTTTTSTNITPQFNLTIKAYSDNDTSGFATIQVSGSGNAFTVNNSFTAENIIFERTSNNGPILNGEESSSITLNNCSFEDSTSSTEDSVVIIAGNSLTLKGSISLGEGLQIQACNSKTGTINLDGTFTTGDAKIPLYFTSIDKFIGTNADSPFTGDSTKFDSFILTGHDGYAFDSTGHIVRPGAGGAIKLPEIKYETGLTISCTPDSDGWTFTVKKGDSPIEISDPKCLVTFWGDYLYIFNDGIPYNKETNSYNVKITDSLPPGNYGITFTFTYNEYSYSSSGFSIRDDKYKSFDQVYSPTFYETVTGE